METHYILPIGIARLTDEELKYKLFHLTDKLSTRDQVYCLVKAALIHRNNNNNNNKENREWKACTPDKALNIVIDNENNVIVKNKKGVSMTIIDKEIRIVS